MKKKVLILKNVWNEGPGIIELALRELNMEYMILDYYNDGGTQYADPSLYSGLIIMGGPMAVYEREKYPFIEKEIELVKLFLSENKKILGICLGAQIIAKAVGGDVYREKRSEIGFFDLYINKTGRQDKYFSSFPDQLKVFQWHWDTFKIPDSCQNLGVSDSFNNQIIRVNNNCYGLQFHFETDYNMIMDWLDHSKDLLKQQKQTILKEATVLTVKLNDFGLKFFKDFFRS